MNRKIKMHITGTGSYIPPRAVANSAFLTSRFFDSDKKPFPKPNSEVVDMLESISRIAERRYVSNDLCTSDIAALAAEEALQSSGTNRESLDFIIVAHNFGDVHELGGCGEMVPCLAGRVKNQLRIKNYRTVAWDVIFGCPGWLQGMIQANSYIRSGDGRRGLVIGAETLSRVSDPHDRNSMLFGDGAGAAIVEGVETDDQSGFLKWGCRSDTLDDAYHLWMGPSDNPDYPQHNRFLKMNGRSLYKYAIKTVHQELAEIILSAGLTLQDISAVLLHQANAKMDEAILDNLKASFGVPESQTVCMPMTISWLGNSSVATVPTLLDLMMQGKLEYRPVPGDWVIMASVGAGMNVNAMLYRIPSSQ